MSDIAKVRLLIPDLDPDNRIMTDDEIDGLLEMWGNNPMRAAASAMLTIANDTAKLFKLSTDDLSVDAAATANSMRENARLLFQQADRAEARGADEAFTIAFPGSDCQVVPEATAHPYPWCL